MTVRRRKKSKRKRRANCESKGNKTAQGLEGANKQGNIEEIKRRPGCGEWEAEAQDEAGAVEKQQPRQVLQPMTRCLALVSYRQPPKSLKAGSGLIGFSVLDYSGCFVENGLQSSKTECGKTS